ncbi:MAG TPA: amidohydrolase, partial [Corynebacterium amycolatum]|nr:amidohydrolase [Corynebacterium amycolatum]
MVNGMRTEIQIALDALNPSKNQPPERPAASQTMPAAGSVPPRPRKAGLGTPKSHAGQARASSSESEGETSPSPEAATAPNNSNNSNQSQAPREDA